MIAWVAVVAVAGTWDDVRARRADDAVELPSPVQRLDMASLVAEVARAAPGGTLPAELADRARALGFDLTVREGVAILAETATARHGGGLYAVRLGPLPTELVLQAPHPFFDLGTGELAADLFDAGGVRALCIATANRDAAEGADPAHTPESWFQAVTQGLESGLPSPRVVQLHGFGSDRTDACAVLSEGPAHVPPATLAALVPRLESALACPDVRTGAEVPALAARTNVQGRLLADGAVFLHLELSPGARRRLLADAGARAALAGVLEGPLEAR